MAVGVLSAVYESNLVYEVTESGGTWGTPTVLTPGAFAAGDTVQVTCPSSTRCVVVGSVQPDGGVGPLPFADVESSGSWHRTILLLPRLSPTSLAGSLDGVSCAKATMCVAVGAVQWDDPSSSNPEASLLPVAYTLSQQTWSSGGLVSMPPTASARSVGGELSAVSCPAPTSCEAIGDAVSKQTRVGTYFPFSVVLEPHATIGAPSAPTSLGVHEAQSALIVRWAAPTTDGGSPIAGYRITVATPQRGVATCVTVSYSCRFPAPAGHTYRVSVVAVNHANWVGPAVSEVVRVS
jgi:hypothetical protein